ncbi:MAG: hypothetical protein JO348_05095 [Alphaproteobacteria bacterium]|nr:hypothetical protein [Alphaproteobacteria bacterium]MBV9541746.1 hypothetical protein [Alphaproteobacteria bacterium]MBV9904133.1 hypothetical protein [Alphaproteobacteria bacterium]
MTVEVSNGGSGGNTFLAFIVGAVLIALVVLGFFMFTGGRIPGMQPSGPSLNVNVHAPSMPKPTTNP